MRLEVGGMQTCDLKEYRQITGKNRAVVLSSFNKRQAKSLSFGCQQHTIRSSIKFFKRLIADALIPEKPVVKLFMGKQAFSQFFNHPSFFANNN